MLIGFSSKKLKAFEATMCSLPQFFFSPVPMSVSHGFCNAQVEEKFTKLEGIYKKAMATYNPEKHRLSDWKALRAADTDGHKEAKELVSVMKVSTLGLAL